MVNCIIIEQRDHFRLLLIFLFEEGEGGGTPVKIDIVPISDVFPPRNSSLLNLFVVENASMILQLKPDEFHKSPMSTRPHIILARS